MILPIPIEGLTLLHVLHVSREYMEIIVSLKKVFIEPKMPSHCRYRTSLK
jgi:hypothetical protein